MLLKIHFPCCILSNGDYKVIAGRMIYFMVSLMEFFFVVFLITYFSSQSGISQLEMEMKFEIDLVLKIWSMEIMSLNLSPNVMLSFPDLKVTCISLSWRALILEWFKRTEWVEYQNEAWYGAENINILKYIHCQLKFMRWFCCLYQLSISKMHAMNKSLIWRVILTTLFLNFLEWLAFMPCLECAVPFKIANLDSWC